MKNKGGVLAAICGCIWLSGCMVSHSTTAKLDVVYPVNAYDLAECTFASMGAPPNDRPYFVTYTPLKTQGKAEIIWGTAFILQFLETSQTETRIIGLEPDSVFGLTETMRAKHVEPCVDRLTNADPSNNVSGHLR